MYIKAIQLRAVETGVALARWYNCRVRHLGKSRKPAKSLTYPAAHASETSEGAGHRPDAERLGEGKAWLFWDDGPLGILALGLALAT